jgi:hypothetical protein
MPSTPAMPPRRRPRRLTRYDSGTSFATLPNYRQTDLLGAPFRSPTIHLRIVNDVSTGLTSLRPYLLVVQKGLRALARQREGPGKCTRTKIGPGTSLDQGPPVHLNLKPLGPCAALKEGEILNISHALILSMTIPVKGNAARRIRCDVFHSREQAHSQVRHP